MKIRGLICVLCVLAVLVIIDCAGERVPSVSLATPEIADVRETPAATAAPERAVQTVDNSLDPQRYTLDEEQRASVLDACAELARLCDEKMKNAPCEKGEYFPYDEVLARETIDELEKLLAGLGYTVMNTDSVYPAYAENSEALESFMASVYAGVEARQSIVNVTQWKSVGYSLFEYRGGEAWHICAAVNWDGDGEFSISEPYREAVREWGMVDGEFFYYRIYPFDAHWDACVPVRLHPANEELYGLGEKYIRPVGYQSVNLFLTDWSTEDWGGLNFNDVFEYLYFMRFGERVDVGSFEYSEDMKCCLVPAEVFEGPLLPYFEISAQELRSRAMYIAGSDSYPWQPVISTNLMYFPTVMTEVRDCRENADGSITLTADVLCFDEKCFPLYTHELTVMEGGDGEFIYLANELTYVSGHSMPNADPRLGGRR